MKISNYPDYTINSSGVVLDSNKRIVKKYEGEDGMVVKLKKDNIIFVEYIKDLYMENTNKSKIHTATRKVMCIENGYLYDSIGDCCREVGNGVTRNLYGRAENHKGFHYKFVD